MKFGTILLWGDDRAAFESRLRLAQQLGYDWIGVGDSQCGYRELFVSLAVAADTDSFHRAEWHCERKR